MRGVIKVGIALILVLLVVGLVVTCISGVRHAGHRTGCTNNLRIIGSAFPNHHDTYGHYPTGTVPEDLPPEKRFSWLVQICPDFLVGGHRTLIDKTKPWDAEGNCPPWERVRIDDDGNTRDGLVGELKEFLCPANEARTGPELPCPTHYLGIAGVGEDAAMLPLSNQRAGFFGYDRKISERDIKDGLATTLAVAETLDGGASPFFVFQGVGKRVERRAKGRRWSHRPALA